ncbi:hypothetical protein C9374_010910 [Naegleria lovaniensis]|uniref:Uncharacterized protein n=1 Tax=Naegleria lovaniensis TaxID=51637 RepID=A0AA88GAQ0_NAELO|nr:uncharacterized protein C9374_010910 [Naegleria lovaniensis]KAG2374340.1 hypothetical protein C9374_010910 [Naegleria lovaniensis]
MKINSANDQPKKQTDLNSSLPLGLFKKDSSRAHIVLLKLSNIEWIQVLAYGVFDQDFRECRNLFLSCKTIYEMTHENDWFWKLMIHIMLWPHVKKNRGCYGSVPTMGQFIRDVDSLAVLAKKTKFHTRLIKRDDPPKTIFLTIYRKVVCSTGYHEFVPRFSQGICLDRYLEKVDFNLKNNFHVQRMANNNAFLIRNFERFLIKMRYDNEYAGSALDFELEAYQISLSLAFRNAVQSSCSLLKLEIEQLHTIVSGDTLFKNRLQAINQLIDRKEAYSELLEVACDHYRFCVAKYHKKPNFDQILQEDFIKILEKLNERKYYSWSLIGSSYSSIFSLIFKRIYLETVSLTNKFSLIERLPSNIVLPFPVSHFTIFESIINELHTYCEPYNHTISFYSDHSLFSFISHHYESTKSIANAIMNKKVHYLVRLKDMLDFVTFHHDKFIDIVSLTKIYLEQNQSGIEIIASVLNNIFVKNISFETQSQLIEQMIKNFQEMEESLQEQPFNLLHSLCCNYYQHLSDLESSSHFTQEEIQMKVTILSNDFNKMAQYLSSLGFHRPCKDSKIIESILTSRLKRFFNDNPYENIPSTLTGTLNFLSFDFSSTEVVDIATLIDRNHFGCPQLMFYSSMKIETAFGNQQWMDCFAYLCGLLEQEKRSSSKLFEFNIAPLEEYSLTDFKHELYSSLIVCYFDMTKVLP